MQLHLHISQIPSLNFQSGLCLQQRMAVGLKLSEHSDGESITGAPDCRCCDACLESMYQSLDMINASHQSVGDIDLLLLGVLDLALKLKKSLICTGVENLAHASSMQKSLELIQSIYLSQKRILRRVMLKVQGQVGGDPGPAPAFFSKPPDVCRCRRPGYRQPGLGP